MSCRSRKNHEVRRAFSNSVFSSAIHMTVFFHIISHLHKPFLLNLITVQSRSQELVAHVISVLTCAPLPLMQIFLLSFLTIYGYEYLRII